MSMTWLANVHEETFWAHQTWTDFRDLPEKDRYTVILPVFGLADHGLGLPLDVEEVIGSAILHGAVARAHPTLPLRVLPPLRYCLGPYPNTFFGLDPETAHDLVREIAESVQAAGFKRLLFFVTSPWNETFVDAASRDTRAGLGLQTFVINQSGLDLDYHPTSVSRESLQAIGVSLLNQLPTDSLPGDNSDVDFRPGRHRQPAPLPASMTLEAYQQKGAELLKKAQDHLARLLAEVNARGPLGTREKAKPPAPLRVPPEPVAQTVWPDGYRHRYLPALTRTALADLPEKEKVLVVVQTGAIEQHGPHLPVGVDAILGQAWLDRLIPRVPEDLRLLVLPPITYTKSNEHVGFPGTVFTSAKTLRRLLLLHARQIAALGFKQFAILNSHGGNNAVLAYTLQEIQTTLGLRAGWLSSAYRPPMSPQEALYGFHANEWETSLMLAAAPRTVKMERAVCEYPAHIDDPGELRPENAPAIFSWISRDISTTGVMGDATIGTAEKGEIGFRGGVDGFLAHLAKIRS